MTAKALKREDLGRAKLVKEKVADLVTSSDLEYFAAVIRAIERSLKCRIIIEESNEEPIKGSNRALTYSRPVKISATWPKKRTIETFEHYIVFDADLPDELVPKVIAHELGHVVVHLGKDPPSRKYDKHGNILYSSREEFEADFFAACLLRYQPSTALRQKHALSKSKVINLATQYGDLVGAEKLFGSIEHLRELVKRGYLS